MKAAGATAAGTIKTFPTAFFPLHTPDPVPNTIDFNLLAENTQAMRLVSVYAKRQCSEPLHSKRLI
jgi:hypothetical protein